MRKKYVAMAFLSLMLILLQSCTPSVEEKNPRCTDCNIVLIVVDALRADHLGLYGYDKETSPNIDSFFSKGIVFENAMSQGVWTLPSVTSYMTSRYVSAHGVYRFARNKTVNNLSEDIKTITEYLRDDGYTTKALLANRIVKNRGIMRGFDEIEYLADKDKWITDESTSWIDKNQDTKFFLYLHYMAPHASYDPPIEYRQLFSEGDKGNLEYENKHQWYFNGLNMTDDDTNDIKARYDGEIRFIDDEIGKLIKNLRSNGLLNSTMILFIADHGEALGEEYYEKDNPMFRNIMGNITKDNQKIVGHGYMLYDIARVPAMLYAPNIESERYSKNVESIDFMPTLLSLADVRYGNTDGIDLFGNKVKTYTLTQHFFIRKSTEFRFSGIRQDNLFLIRMNDNSSDKETLLLYDLSKDPQFRDDVADENPDKVKELLGLID